VTETKGTIFDIQRFSIHDGPGIRTTVFLKGCTLSCVWCHNPEGMTAPPNLSFLPAKCIGCRCCERLCPEHGHNITNKAHTLDRTNCRVCGLCTKECFSGALELVGRTATVEEVIQTVLRDKPFYETSGGGMTLSGGEPLQQADFTMELLKSAKGYGLNCAIETCGNVPYSAFKCVLPFVDLFLYDVKETDSARHAEYTGCGNKLILENLRRLHDDGASILLRLPIIPGLNDRDAHFKAVAALAAALPHLRGVDILPYHRLGESKAARFDVTARIPQIVTPTTAQVAGWIARLKELGVNATGPG